MINSVSGVSLTNVSFRVHHDHHYHAVTRGRIVNGVLTTEPVDVLLRSAYEEMSHYHLRDARFRGEIRADGSLAGILGGYQDIAKVYWNVARDRSTTENVQGPMTCPGLYYALQRLADAYPVTPGGGQCTWISSAYEVDGLPAFVIHPKDD